MLDKRVFFICFFNQFDVPFFRDSQTTHNVCYILKSFYTYEGLFKSFCNRSLFVFVIYYKRSLNYTKKFPFWRRRSIEIETLF